MWDEIIFEVKIFEILDLKQCLEYDNLIPNTQQSQLTLAKVRKFVVLRL